MAARLSYMGTKQWVAAEVAKIVQDLPSGPLLDAFSGMCAVGHQLAAHRIVWTNDVQVFPALYARVTLCNGNENIGNSAWTQFHKAFYKNFHYLCKRYQADLELEEQYINSQKLDDVIKGNCQKFVGNDRSLAHQRERLAKKPRSFPYRLATITYAGAFFGVRQCIEIDSLRFAIDYTHKVHLISNNQVARMLIALGLSAARSNNSTGHFANFLSPSGTNFKRVITQRKRSIYRGFMHALSEIYPVAPPDFISINKAFNFETNKLLKTIAQYKIKPAIIFADPPYTEVQYSRYYHVLDTLIRYDYPVATGNGRYPNGRFQTPFSHVRQVAEAMERLVRRSADLGATLLVSYPTNGLLKRNDISMMDILRRAYKKVAAVVRRKTEHSTMGSSFVSPTQAVSESIYLAWNP